MDPQGSADSTEITGESETPLERVARVGFFLSTHLPSVPFPLVRFDTSSIQLNGVPLSRSNHRSKRLTYMQWVF